MQVSQKMTRLPACSFPTASMLAGHFLVGFARQSCTVLDISLWGSSIVTPYATPKPVSKKRFFTCSVDRVRSYINFDDYVSEWVKMVYRTRLHASVGNVAECCIGGPDAPSNVTIFHIPEGCMRPRYVNFIAVLYSLKPHVSIRNVSKCYIGGLRVPWNAA